MFQYAVLSLKKTGHYKKLYEKTFGPQFNLVDDEFNGKPVKLGNVRLLLWILGLGSTLAVIICLMEHCVHFRATKIEYYKKWIK